MNLLGIYRSSTQKPSIQEMMDQWMGPTLTRCAQHKDHQDSSEESDVEHITEKYVKSTLKY